MADAADATDLVLAHDRARAFPAIEHPSRYRSARVWNCGYRTFAPLAQFTSLESLQIMSFPDDTLDVLSSLKRLALLRIVHLPKVTDLSPLAALTSLRALALETLPSWDASTKATDVESLTPLASLPHLEEVRLYGVRPASRTIDELFASSSVRRAYISKFAGGEAERLAEEMAKRGGEGGKPRMGYPPLALE